MILVHYLDQWEAGCRRVVLRELLEALPLGASSTASWHIRHLAAEGLLQKARGGSYELTREGRAAAAYIRAYHLGDSCFTRAVRQVFGRRTRRVLLAIKEAAAQMDASEKAQYLSTAYNADLTRLRRQLTARDVLRVVRKAHTWDEAARLAGIQGPPLQVRLKRILERARQLLEQSIPAPPILQEVAI